MRPLLEKIPQRKRNLYFALAAPGLSLFAFFVMGFVLTSAAPELSGFLLSILFGVPVGVTVAWRLYGWPKLLTRGGAPLVDPKWKPYLFFPLAVLFTFLVYVVLGVFLTPVLPPVVLTYVVLGAGVLVGVPAAFLLVGFPRVDRLVREQWARIPLDRRPYLFFPIAALATVGFFYLLGLALMQTNVALQAQPLIAIGVGLVLGCVVAYFLVGFPKPKRKVREMIPEVPGRARPLAFGVTWLLAGLPLAYLAGLALSFAPVLPGGALLPLALVLGYAAALGVAALAWGTPRSWRRFADYKPGLPEGARAALFFPIVVAGGVIGSVGAFFADVPLFWGILAGGSIGVLVGLRVSGALGKLREVRGSSPTLLPEMPDMVKPLVLFPAWFLVSLLAYLVLANLIPDLLAVAVVVALVLGLATGLVLVEESTIRDALAVRKAERARAAERKKRRAEALAAVTRAPSGKKA